MAVLDELSNTAHDVRVAKPASAPIAMAEGPLKTFLVPLGSALIGASRESVEAAITNDIASSESAIASFVAATTADACLLMGVAEGVVSFSRNFSPLPERFVAVGRSAASGAALSSIIEEYGDSADLGEHCAVVLSGRGGAHGQTETLAVARQLLRAAVRPLVAEASSGGTEAEEAMAPRLVAVAQRLGDLEAALGRCDRRARLAEATLAPPAAVEPWQDFLAAEIAQAQKQGIDVEAKGFHLVVRTNGRIGGRVSGMPGWGGIIASLASSMPNKLDRAIESAGF